MTRLKVVLSAVLSICLLTQFSEQIEHNKAFGVKYFSHLRYVQSQRYQSMDEKWTENDIFELRQ
jgi:hypothetical protein